MFMGMLAPLRPRAGALRGVLEGAAGRGMWPPWQWPSRLRFSLPLAGAVPRALPPALLRGLSDQADSGWQAGRGRDRHSGCPQPAPAAGLDLAASGP